MKTIAQTGRGRIEGLQRRRQRESRAWSRAAAVMSLGRMLSAGGAARAEPGLAAGATVPAGTCRSASFTIDGVGVTLLSARGFPSCTFSVDEPGARTQVATSFQTAPFREVTLTAIPFGHDGPTEGVRSARRGSV